MDTPGDVTQWLRRLRDGDGAALDRLVALLYDDLRALARRRLRDERSDHTLSATAVVNEIYLRLLRQNSIEADDRGQFFAIAANTMRRVLVDYARARKRLKRGSGAVAVPIEEVAEFLTEDEADEVLGLDAALEKLAEMNPRAAEVVQLRFYAGFSLEEAAEILGVSTKTVQRDWIAARAWLRKEVGGFDVPDSAPPAR